MRHITFTDDNMTISAKKCSESALFYGCDESSIIMPDDLEKKWADEFIHILDQPRGAGYWLWKPKIILDELENMKDGEMLVYTDAGLTFQNNIDLMVKEMNHPVMVFGNRWIHGDWCKMDVLRGMGCEQFADREQLQASCLIIKNSVQARHFIGQWLAFAEKPGFIDDSPSITPNPERYREHRHDQAILTNLTYLMGIPVHWWPAQYNVRNRNKYSNKYPVMFEHLRKRNDEW